MKQPIPSGSNRPGSLRCSAQLFHLFAILLLYSTCSFPANRIRVAVLEFGTVSWELEVIKRHHLDREQDLELDIVKLAGKQATLVALQAGAVDIAVSDWIWVSRQREAGKPLTFVPYSTALGALVVPQGSSIKSLADLRGRRLGIAGGPVDKSWLLLQALALQDYDMDLKQTLTPVFAAPPLLNQQLKQGRIDAVLNFWPYIARLKAAGMQPLIGIEEVTRRLGIGSEVPFVGYVFDEHWAAENREAVQGFIRAATKARTIMENSDQEWALLRPRMKAPDDATFKALREGFRNGIPHHWNQREQQDSEKLFDILSRLGGAQLMGNTTRLSEGTFWPEVSY